MNTIASVHIKNKTEGIKYAYAFMKTNKLNLKECSFFNPQANKFDGKHIFPQDMFSAGYSGNIPSWEEFKSNPSHISSLGFNCVGCIDERDQKRVVCALIDNNVFFNCYGNYENEAKKAFEDIKEIVLTLS